VKDLEIKFSEGRVENLDIKSTTVEELLKNLGIDPLEVIVQKEGHVVQDNEIILKDDNIQIIQVIHGG
jgi:sulfur carrier protein